MKRLRSFSLRPGREGTPAAQWAWLRVEAVRSLALPVAFLLLLFAGLHWFWLAQQPELGPAAQSRLIAQALAGQVHGLLEGYRGMLALVAGEPESAALVRGGDVVAIARREEQLARLFPGALKVRLLSPELDPLDKDSASALGFAAQAMLADVAEGKGAAPEAHLAHAQSFQVNLAQRISEADGQSPAGLILLSLDLALLQQTLDRLPGAPGYVELVQRAAGEEVVLAKRGDPTLRAGVPQQAVALEGLRWEVHYWSGSLGAPLPWPIALWAVFAFSAAWLVGLWRLQNRGGIPMPEAPVPIQEKPAIAPVAALPRAPSVEVAVVERSQARKVPPAPPVEPAREPVPDSIFGPNGVRGVTGESLTPGIAHQLGQAVAAEVLALGESRLLLGRDARNSSHSLAAAVQQGILESGCEVIDLGEIPTPLLYFATHHLSCPSGVMVTGGHRPPEYNGLNVVLAGEPLSVDAAQVLRNRIAAGDFQRGSGRAERREVMREYLERIAADVGVALPLDVVVDCGNGMAGAVAPSLFEALGCSVTELNCTVDGRFPHGVPDPTEAGDRHELIETVKQLSASVGLLFGGDGTRLGVVDSDGRVVWPDRQLMLFATDVLARNPGANIVHDTGCSRHLSRLVTEFGGRPLMGKSGYVSLKAKMEEVGALLAGGMSGHICFKDRWNGFNDALYTAARLLEVLGSDPRNSSDIFDGLPAGISTPLLRVAVPESEKYRLVERLGTEGYFPGSEVMRVDGVRVEFAEGWGMVRPSNRQACLVLRFEAETDAELAHIQGLFREQLLMLAPGLQLPF